MGAEIFLDKVSGKTAKDAFNNAVQDALYEHGHGGYTGTIAEKTSFVMLDIKVPQGEDFESFAEYLLDLENEPNNLPQLSLKDKNLLDQLGDKWGPAGCIALENGQYGFFGWASS